jgi:tetratricopeptide (TPR) repeat protein
VRWVVLGAILVAALVGGIAIASALAGDEEAAPETTPSTAVQTVRVTQPGTTVRAEVTVTAARPTTPAPPETTRVAGASGVELTDEATALLRAGRYEEAAAAAQQALESLGGTGELYEAYALYDLGAALAELGDCKGATKALKRSEKLQGSRTEIDAALAKCN